MRPLAITHDHYNIKNLEQRLVHTGPRRSVANTFLGRPFHRLRGARLHRLQPFFRGQAFCFRLTIGNAGEHCCQCCI